MSLLPNLLCTELKQEVQKIFNILPPSQFFLADLICTHINNSASFVKLDQIALHFKLECLSLLINTCHLF